MSHTKNRNADYGDDIVNNSFDEETEMSDNDILNGDSSRRFPRINSVKGIHLFLPSYFCNALIYYFSINNIDQI